ncbi:hypothetical protein COI60_24870 [Bacillus toyonensis]|uniref:hypothetical protein n=1 Tax=Bacillus toyonensis TaxID=155322 RepID=UPI000BFBC06C|nr:hypothetical protein [Bacillus toyonensis]PHG30407.1 hypothetical protein COI60_24870 [Bacillus toyonensis]
MIGKSKKKVFNLVIFVVFLATFFSFTLILLLINKGIIIDQNSINLLDMFIKSSFTLLGSTLSGVIAVFVFSLQEESRRKEKLESQIKYYKNLKREFENNINVLEKIESMMDNGTLEEVASDIVAEKEVKEILLVMYTQLNFTFYLNNLNEIRIDKYENSIRVFQLSYQIYKYLEIIIKELDDKGNVKALLAQMKRDIVKIKSLQTIMEDENLLK